MSAMILDGKALAGEIYTELAQRVQELSERGVTPTLAVILAGDDPASQIYVRNKARACKRCGIRSLITRLPASVSQEELTSEIERLNADPSVHGILVQMPLPNGLDEQRALCAVDPAKDVDGLHPVNAGALMTGRPRLLPCTPAGCMALIHKAGVRLEGARAVVIGRSNIVGKPMSLLLLSKNCTVTVCHSRTQALASVTREADVVVAAVGKPGMVTGDMIKPGAVVIDVGINRSEDGHVCGDADFESVSAVAGAITPVPGGVGPMTIAMLMKNTVEAAAHG